MKAKGFGAWPLRNESSGGQKSSFDEYNRHLKGKAYQNYEEYNSRTIPEYNHYPMQKDMTSVDRDEQNPGAAGQRGRRKDTKSRTKRIVQQAVVLVAGSIMITSAYQARINADQAAQQAAEPPAIVEPTEPGNSGDNTGENGALPTENPTQPTEAPTEPTEAPTEPSEDATEPTEPAESTEPAEDATQPGGGTTPDSSGNTVSWSWSSDGTTATMVVTDSSGSVISETAATVTTTETPATCTANGRITHTASGQADGQTYTDTRYEDTPALGHEFDSGTELTLDSGETATDFECTRCHEHFVIQNSVTEE